jgi:hemerythrin superfamily protein
MTEKTMDALTLLTADHNRVRGLFARFQDAENSGEVTEMAELMHTIDEELTVHTDIEETVFYPWAHRLSDDIAEAVDEGMEEHHVVKALLDEIRVIEPGDSQWVAKITVVIENVQHHAEEEETELFPQVRGATDANSRDQLGRDLEERKATLGAPVLADKQDLTTEQLHDMATEQKIPGRSTMDHDELAATVSPH